MQRSTPGAACLRRFWWPPCLRLCSCQTDGPSEPETSTRCRQSLLLIFSNTAILPSQSLMQDANSNDDPLPASLNAWQPVQMPGGQGWLRPQGRGQRGGHRDWNCCTGGRRTWNCCTGVIERRKRLCKVHPDGLQCPWHRCPARIDTAT